MVDPYSNSTTPEPDNKYLEQIALGSFQFPSVPENSSERSNIPLVQITDPVIRAPFLSMWKCWGGQLLSHIDGAVTFRNPTGVRVVIPPSESPLLGGCVTTSEGGEEVAVLMNDAGQVYAIKIVGEEGFSVKSYSLTTDKGPLDQGGRAVCLLTAPDGSNSCLLFGTNDGQVHVADIKQLGVENQYDHLSVRTLDTSHYDVIQGGVSGPEGQVVTFAQSTQRNPPHSRLIVWTLDPQSGLPQGRSLSNGDHSTRLGAAWVNSETILSITYGGKIELWVHSGTGEQSKWSNVTSRSIDDQQQEKRPWSLTHMSGDQWLVGLNNGGIEIWTVNSDHYWISKQGEVPDLGLKHDVTSLISHDIPGQRKVFTAVSGRQQISFQLNEGAENYDVEIIALTRVENTVPLDFHVTSGPSPHLICVSDELVTWSPLNSSEGTNEKNTWGPDRGSILSSCLTSWKGNPCVIVGLSTGQAAFLVAGRDQPIFVLDPNDSWVTSVSAFTADYNSDIMNVVIGTDQQKFFVYKVNCSEFTIEEIWQSDRLSSPVHIVSAFQSTCLAVSTSQVSGNSIISLRYQLPESSDARTWEIELKGTINDAKLTYHPDGIGLIYCTSEGTYYGKLFNDYFERLGNGANELIRYSETAFVSLSESPTFYDVSSNVRSIKPLASITTNYTEGSETEFFSGIIDNKRLLHAFTKDLHVTTFEGIGT